MDSPWVAAISALFLWWFSTGIILLIIRRGDASGRSGPLGPVLFFLPVLLLGIAGFVDTLNDDSVTSVYVAFISTLAIWGWIEMTFLTGLVTGPNTRNCPKGLPEWERFLRAWGTIAYHELLLFAAFVAMALMSRDAVNPFGFWTFALLFVARISAKLNLFFGVPRINTEFIPSALAHLPSHFRFSAMNGLFPISVTLLTLATACWLERLLSSEGPGMIVGFALLTALTALALLEHWFMVVPLPDAKLWRWLLPAPNPEKD